MKHIVFLVGDYYPDFMAVGSCIYNVVKEIEDVAKVTVICPISQDQQQLYEVFEKHTIVRFRTENITKRYKLNNDIKKCNKFKKIIKKIGIRWIQIKNYMKAILQKCNVDQQLIKGYTNALSSIEEPIDAIIAACIPFETTLAAIDSCKRSIVIPYFFDPFSDNEALHRLKFNQRLKRKNHLKMENIVVQNSHKIIVMKHMLSHFQSNFAEYMSKVIVMEHPTLVIKGDEENRKHDKKITLTYAGAFNKGIREPDYLLKLMSNLDKNIILQLFHMGNCDNIILKYSQNNNANIYSGGRISKEIANQELYNSNILVSIGNKVSNQTPSKIFEFIGLRKPIIHLYYLDSDEVLNILKSYPYALCLKQSEKKYQYNREKILEFCLENENKKADVMLVKELYREALPKNTANLILDMIE